MIINKIPDQDISFIMGCIREASAQHILPKFRNLSSELIDFKTSPNDLVTQIDVSVEEQLIEKFSHHFQCLVIGEELVSEKPEVKDRLHKEALAIVVDPLDGTNSFVDGSLHFGLMVSVISYGEVVYAAIYSPLTDDFVHAQHKCGAFYVKDWAFWSTPICVSNRELISEMRGYLPAHSFDRYGSRHKNKMIDLSKEFHRVMSLHCSAEEYRSLATGAWDFSLSANVNPWDHLAGSLIVREAGGVVRMLSDGRTYDASVMNGFILTTNNQKNWDLIRSKLTFLKDIW